MDLGKYQDLYLDKIWLQSIYLPCSEGDINESLIKEKVKYPEYEIKVIALTKGEWTSKEKCLFVYFGGTSKKDS